MRPSLTRQVFASFANADAKTGQDKIMRTKHCIKIKAQPEAGQAIVILALVMVALIGFLGLVVDGGGLLFLQRDAQNATDAAVIAATYARCTNATRGDVI